MQFQKCIKYNTRREQNVALFGHFERQTSLYANNIILVRIFMILVIFFSYIVLIKRAICKLFITIGHT